MECKDPLSLEQIIKQEFSSKFRLIAGHEFFEGNERLMLIDFSKIVLYQKPEEDIDELYLKK